MAPTAIASSGGGGTNRRVWSVRSSWTVRRKTRTGRFNLAGPREGWAPGRSRRVVSRIHPMRREAGGRAPVPGEDAVRPRAVRGGRRRGSWRAIQLEPAHANTHSVRRLAQRAGRYEVRGCDSGPPGRRTARSEGLRSPPQPGERAARRSLARDAPRTLQTLTPSIAPRGAGRRSTGCGQTSRGSSRHNPRRGSHRCRRAG